MKESVVEGRLVSLVEQTGGIIRKAQWVNRRGCPDRWCGWPSTRWAGWVETKKPKTPHAERHQAREHERLRSCGEDVRVLATIEEVEAFVAEATNINIGQIRAL